MGQFNIFGEEEKEFGKINKIRQKLEDYDGFVEKFKPKLTTDDCYTPPP